jgi:hypothetical protein
MATGLSIESYTEAENNEVGKLINALETAKIKEEAEAVITEHSATVKAQVDATACRSEIARRSTLPGATTQRAENND